MKTIIQSIKEDISKFMEDNETLFFNEREFQMHLCVMLKESPNEYDDIYLEYRIPQYVFFIQSTECHPIFRRDTLEM